MPFLVVLVFWLSMVFFGIHLFIAPSRIVIASMFVGALCLSAAIFLILQLNSPLEGLMRISSAPLRRVLGILGQ
jgi:nitric oxide reductase large subunit